MHDTCIAQLARVVAGARASDGTTCTLLNNVNRVGFYHFGFLVFCIDTGST